MKQYWIYMMSNFSNGVLYIGVTNDLFRRVSEHRLGLGCHFTQKYKLAKLVYYEVFSEVEFAIRREKELKGWRRDRKNELIAAINPEWKDLYDELA